MPLSTWIASKFEIKHKDHDFVTEDNKQNLMKQACFNVFTTTDDNQFFKTLSKISGVATIDSGHFDRLGGAPFTDQIFGEE